jgi:hypothetical protein
MAIEVSILAVAVTGHPNMIRVPKDFAMLA